MDNPTRLRVAEIRKFNRFYTNIIGVVNQTILESPYSLAEARVLLEIVNATQCTASDLSEILQIDPGYLSRILRRFKKEGLIETNKSVTDGRSQILAITEKGRETYSQLSEASSTQLVHLLEQIPQGAQQKLVNHMAAVQNMLSGQSDTAISIRNHRPGDVGYIAYRHGVLYALEHGLDTQVFEKYVLESLVKYLDNPLAGKIFIAECCGTIAGFIGIVETSPTTAQLRWFLIEPEFRGDGLGRKLVATVMEYCRQQNYKHVFLWTFKGLDAARRLYEDFGFKLTEEKENNSWKNQMIEQRWDATLDG
ncbi:helix-turn-helix domain-containing GNAT family N-acetyltransferase [Sporomusa sp.]|uniref:bifunctional helix-turn-helix transcriptional regulator/GNAT family N-acetyltransferase n=1 Tax=Sporomusa sp. TaxID=2078658 RepID=UPI002C053EAD|nr:helix-turn-helix domain-containing GNAT family N-acetyltransferase [Sporomusa sp.]HWR44134.1 helix-turn-helix domain-containing GNAT family N-acetyltransferase [Sporomusa sp.]